MSRIEQLMSAMTLEEKLGQLTMTAAGYAVTGPTIAGDSTEAIKAGRIGNILNLHGAAPVHELQRLAVEQSRLGIPLLIGFDVIHGHRTLFPIPLAEIASFDPPLWEMTAREAAAEAAADGIAMTFAPMLDVSRDPRWGRTAEGPGEDPWLAAQFALAKVSGFQGTDLGSAAHVAACAKHFCAYGAVTAGREYASVDISERTVREVHLPAFAQAVTTGAAAVMPAFTDLAGIPMTANVALLRDCLRSELGFNGVLVSDYNAIAELIRHGIAADLPHAAACALRAGVDIDMMSDAYRKGLPEALTRGLVSSQDVDASVRRVLTLKERLGLFDDPYRRGAQPEPPAALERRRSLARTAAARSIVLLKNVNDVLPLSSTVRRLAVIGPLADAAAEMGGPWSLAAETHSHVSVLAGLKSALPETELVHARGVGIDDAEDAGIPEAVRLCAGSQAVLLCLGEAARMSGEAASRAKPFLPGRQCKLTQAVCDEARARGIPVVAIVFSGRPLVLSELAAQVDALIAAWFLGAEAGHGLADVLTGRLSPNGRTPISWPRALGQVPLFFAQRPSGRPADPKDHYTSKYLDVPNDPLFPFGHGLSYGRFTLANLRVAPERARESDTIEVKVDVTNAGRRSAQETLFLFTHDLVASVARPLLELSGFGKISLRPGETGTVTMTLRAAQLRFLGPALRSVFEPGDIDILVGPSADRALLLSRRIVLI